MPVAIGGDPAQSLIADTVLSSGASASQLPPGTASAPGTAAAAAPQQQAIELSGPTRTVGTQSLYRESEAQTDPYTPDIATVPGLSLAFTPPPPLFCCPFTYVTPLNAIYLCAGEPEPEELTLAHLSYGKGLPATQAEVTAILRARDKRAFEASLPPITDEASFELRKQMLEARELQEWEMRGVEMKKELEARLQIM